MNGRRRLIRLAAALPIVLVAMLHGSVAARAQGGAARCQLIQIAAWPVRLAHGSILLDGTVNDRKVDIAIDTGASKSLILRSSAERLGLTLTEVRGVRMYGIGGATRVEAADIAEITLGGVTRKDMQVFVAGERDFSSRADLLLGEDFLGKVDLEFDLAHNMVRLFEPSDCQAASLAYWASDGGSSVELEPGSDADSKIRLKVAVNGVAVDAMLDSGAAISIIDSALADRLGVTPGAAGVTPAAKLGGMGAKTTQAWKATFATFEIANERIRDAELVIGDFRRVHEERTGSHIMTSLLNVDPILLGADFIRAHRMLVSHGKRRLYFTYVGGPVFGEARDGPASATEHGEAAR